VDPATLERILIVRLGALGDVVHVLPALEALRRALPRARIHWAVETASASLLEGHPDLEGIHVIPRKEWHRSFRRPASWADILKSAEGVFRKLRANAFDLALDFQGNLRSAIVSVLSGAPVRVGFGKGANKEYSHLFYTHRVVPADARLHKAAKNLRLLEALGVSADVLPAPRLPDAGLPDSVRETLAECTRPLVVIHAGVSPFGALKAYPTRAFAKVGRLFSEGTGGSVLFSYGPGEKEGAEALARESGPRARPAPECRTLPELAALLREADAFLGVDTGPTQLAGAARVPVVALFGPKDPVVYRPLGERVRVLASRDPGLDCIPCNGRSCPRADEQGFSPCMTALDPEEVVGALLEAVGADAPPRRDAAETHNL